MLLGSLLLALVLLSLMAIFIWPAMYLLPVPAGGLLLGVWLIVRGAQPLWAKLLALSPALGPLLLLILIEAVTLLPPPQNHLVFLVPIGFRGQVALSQSWLVPEPEPLVNGQLLLETPRKGSGGNIDIKNPLAATDLRTADYYVVTLSGERLYQLPQLTEPAFAPTGQPGGAAADPRQVGIFVVDPPPDRPQTGLRSLAASLRRFATNPYNQVHRLTFVVARRDSLAIQRQWAKW